MLIKSVSEVLNQNGLATSKINALLPTVDNYKTLLFQPLGHIEATGAGVRNRDRGLARRQFAQFLKEARDNQADLVITPEYSMPWEVLSDAIKSAAGPTAGKLWVLGCESVKYNELDKIREDLADEAVVLYEALEPDPSRFVDPLAYVFVATTSDARAVPKPVILIQFKTHPMGDEDHFEVNGLQRGTCVYRFGGGQHCIGLISLICSDVFAFSDNEAKSVYDRALIIHIQLNQKPRQELYRRYRERLFQYKGDATELICLNWASNVHEWIGEQSKPWGNIAGSAWYLKPTDFDDRDEPLRDNHRRGLYYTWLPSLRTHALFFNYKAATFLLEVTKVVHIGVSAAVSHLRGPLLARRCIWDDPTSSWVVQENAEDEFSAIVSEAGDAKDEIQRIAKANPFAAERLLALCAGNIDNHQEWYALRRLDSCIIAASEIIHRLTFGQDTDEGANMFRIARLRRCARLWQIVKAGNLLPPSLAAFKHGFRLEWVPNFPHQNAVSTAGQRATLIYMGEESSTTQIEATAKRVAEYLQRSLNPNDALLAKQRVAVWFRDDSGEVVIYDAHRYVRIDKADNRSEVDIGREQ